jgi:hypothetical protein
VKTYGSISASLLTHMPGTYRDALDRPLTAAGFAADSTTPFDSIASTNGHTYSHPTGVGVLLHADAIRIAYRAPWADPEYDREAWFDLPYGTSFEVVVDLAAALVDKVDADMNAADG